MRGDSGLVLAGGLGMRLGLGVPKARAECAGRTLLERAVATLASACDDVIVVAPAHADIGAHGTARRVFDAPGFEGPLAGLVAGLEACMSECAVVLGVDFPLVTAATLRALLDALHATPEALAVIPRPGDIAQPLVSSMRITAAGMLRTTLDRGERSLRRAIEPLPIRWLDDAAIAALPGGAAALLNVNTPADLAAARETLAARAASGSAR